jgi:undecaprenyl pyrophosphate synthase
MERQNAQEALEEPLVQPKIYVLPAYEKPSQDNLKILVLTDGNNRAMGLNQGYGEGGRNVVKIAQYLAQRGDVKTMVACIMSSDNAAKRSEDFFHKMYQAFVGLGVKMEAEGVLVKENIKMSAYGDLDKLKAQSEVARQFVEMVETVCSKTAHLENPKLNLVLGINYDENIALEQDVQAIYRSGMEQQNAVRLSGIRTHQSINNVGSTTLWPHVSQTEICGVIEHVKDNLQETLGIGYSPEQIVQIIQNCHDHPGLSSQLVIPYTGNSTHLLGLIEEHFKSAGASHAYVTLYDQQDQIIGRLGDPEENTIQFRLKPAAVLMSKHD